MTERPNTRPLYEADQVVTYRDLYGMRNGYVLQYRATRWWEFKNRYKFLVAIGTIDTMLYWLKQGKQIGRYD